MKRPLLLAHRGFSGNYPENSPLAFRMAVEKTAADGFESDVHITKDGKLVIFHDASVERTSNGTGFIKNMTYDELLSLDIGAWKSPEFAGQHIWTFGQLLDFCKETKMLLNMELRGVLRESGATGDRRNLQTPDAGAGVRFLLQPYLHAAFQGAVPGH